MRTFIGPPSVRGYARGHGGTRSAAGRPPKALPPPHAAGYVPGMPAAALAPAPRRPLTLTERNWLTAFAIVVASALLFYALQALERRVGHADRDEAFVYNAMETPMRLVGLAHILIAIAFLTTSRAMKRASSWVWLGGLLAAGVGLCLAFEGAGGMDARLPKVLFFLYFLLHEFRDQAFFYEANGDLPRGGDALRLRRDLQGIPLLALGLIGAVFALLAGLEITGARAVRGAIQHDDGQRRKGRRTEGRLRRRRPAHRWRQFAARLRSGRRARCRELCHGLYLGSAP